MWYEDLSEYEYILYEDVETPSGLQTVWHNKSPQLLNVGWLSADHEFPRGEVSSQVVEHLLNLCSAYVNQTRGYHGCPCCDQFPVTVEHRGKKLTLGSAELRVAGASGITYASPNLIVHYIRDHQYCPPQMFLDAVIEQGSGTAGD